MQITIAGAALMHSRMTFEPKAVFKSGRNTNECRKRDGKWCCSGVNVIAENAGVDD